MEINNRQNGRKRAVRYNKYTCCGYNVSRGLILY